MSGGARQLVVSMAVYGLFTAAAAGWHGAQPDVHIDHLAYIRRAEELLQRFPSGDFWRGYEVRNTFAIPLAWLHGATGDHVASLRIMLAAMSLAWMAGLEWLFRSLGWSPGRARIAALIGAFPLSFGAPQWGVFAFSGALQRTMVMPALFLVLGWYWRARERPARLWALPMAALLCLVHLGSCYLLAILAALELWGWLRPPPALPRVPAARLAGSLLLSAAILLGLQILGLALAPEAAARLIPTVASDVPADRLAPAEAWEVELAALRWRNFPPTAATLAATAASAGPLILLGLLGAWRARGGPPREADAFMRRLALAALAVGLGWQAIIALLRHLLPIYPVNFEEIRAIVWVVPALLYFWGRGVESTAAPGESRAWRYLLVGGVLLVAVPPVQWARTLPLGARSALLDAVVPATDSSPNEVLRARIARQWLGIPGGEPRFYYDALGLVRWLRENTTGADRVLTNRDEARLGPARVLGSPTGFLDAGVRRPSARQWLRLQPKVEDAVARRDLPALLAIAREQGADWVVIEGPAPGAVYTDPHYSVVAVPVE